MQNNFNSIKTQLAEKINKSAESCRTIYQNRVAQLHQKADNIFVSWDEMESKYMQLIASGKAKNKALLRELKNERKQYKTQLNNIKRSLNAIMFNVQKNRLNPEFTV